MNYVYEIPGEMLKEIDKKGTVELLEYESQTYDDSAKKLQKKAWVYLPYGYDDSKQYNTWTGLWKRVSFLFPERTHTSSLSREAFTT